MASIVTPLILDINSDWASFTLLTNGATIGQDPDFAYPPGTQLNNAGVFFGQKESFVVQKVTIRAYIINNGTPVNFATGHGDEGQGGAGQISATFAGNTYLNNSITGDGVNSQTFYEAPVGATP